MHQKFGKRIEDLSEEPYPDPVLGRAYRQLFCDDIEAFRSVTAEKTYPWDVLLSKTKSPEQLDDIVDDEAVESRAKIFAHRAGERQDQHLYGAVLEISVEKSLNVVGAYRDGSARAINSGRLIDWIDLEDEEIREAIVIFLSASQFSMKNMQAWDKPRLPYPTRGLARFSILSSDGLYFGQGTMDKLLKDPIGKPMVEAGMDLLMKLSMKAK